MPDVCYPSPEGWASLFRLLDLKVKVLFKKVPYKVRVKLFDIKFLSEVLDANSAHKLYLSLLDYVGDVEYSETALLLTLQTVFHEFYE